MGVGIISSSRIREVTQVNYTNNIISYWPFDVNSNDIKGINNGSDTLTSYETSGIVNNSTNFTTSNSSVISIPQNGSLSFGNGTNDVPFSFCGWYNFSSLNGSNRAWLLSKRSTISPPNIEYQLIYISGQFQIYLYSNSSASNFLRQVYTFDLTFGDWIHVGFTYDGSGELKLYVNGIEVGTASNIGTYNAMTASLSPVNFGNGTFTSNLDFNGYQDETAFFDKELTALEFLDLYNKGLNNIPIIEYRFIMIVKSDNTGTSNTDQFTIPTLGIGYNYNVATSDGYTATGLTGNHTITFPSGVGTHTVYITGDFPQIYFNNTGDRLKLLDITNWGSIVWSSFQNAYRGCSNLINITATDTPNLTNVLSFRECFRSCPNLNSVNVENWDMTNVENIFFMFYNAFNLSNIDVSNWNIINISVALNFMVGVTLTTSNYDATLIGWEATLQATYPNGVGYPHTISISFGNSRYTIGSLAETARQSLITNFGWTISDGGGI